MENEKPAKKSHLFKPGQSGNPAGKPKGTLNNFTKVRNAWLTAFDQLGGTAGLVKWGRENRGDFYKLLTRLLPREERITLAGESLADVLDRIENRRGDNPPVETESDSVH